MFSIENNIQNLEKHNTITKPVYTHMGRDEETLSFEATILLDDMGRFMGIDQSLARFYSLNLFFQPNDL